MGTDAELLKVYVWNDELIMGRPLHEVIVDRVKGLDRYGLTAVRIFSDSVDNGVPESSQVVIKVIAGAPTIDLVQRFNKQLGSSGWMIRERVAALCC